DQPQRAAALRLFTQRHARGVLSVRVADCDGTILPDDEVRLSFGRREVARRELPSEIDRRHRRTEMKADCPDAEHPVERGRQHVLTGVLLHMIEAPRPVDDTMHTLSYSECSIDHMRDRAVIF